MNGLRGRGLSNAHPVVSCFSRHIEFPACIQDFSKGKAGGGVSSCTLLDDLQPQLNIRLRTARGLRPATMPKGSRVVGFAYMCLCLRVSLCGIGIMLTILSVYGACDDDKPESSGVSDQNSNTKCSDVPVDSCNPKGFGVRVGTSNTKCCVAQLMGGRLLRN